MLYMSMKSQGYINAKWAILDMKDYNYSLFHR